MFYHPQRVKLTADLTKYAAGLTPGTLGWTKPTITARWGVMVQYDNGVLLDTLWRSLEVQEEETKKKQIEVDLGLFDEMTQNLLRLGVTVDDLHKRITENRQAR